MTETNEALSTASNATGSTLDSGAPAASDRNSLSVGSNGPLLLHDVRLVETLAHFNRERVPERNPHAKGAGAFGVFETTEDVSQYTKLPCSRRVPVPRCSPGSPRSLVSRAPRTPGGTCAVSL